MDEQSGRNQNRTPRIIHASPKKFNNITAPGTATGKTAGIALYETESKKKRRQQSGRRTGMEKAY